MRIWETKIGLSEVAIARLDFAGDNDITQFRLWHEHRMYVLLHERDEAGSSSGAPIP